MVIPASRQSSKPTKSRRVPDRERSLVPERTRSSRVCKKNIERLVRSRRGQSPAQGRMSDRSWMAERARTLEKMRTQFGRRLWIEVRHRCCRSRQPLLRIAWYWSHGPRRPHKHYWPRTPVQLWSHVAKTRNGTSEASPPLSRAIERRRRFPKLRVSKRRIWKVQASSTNRSPSQSWRRCSRGCSSINCHPTQEIHLPSAIMLAIQKTERLQRNSAPLNLGFWYLTVGMTKFRRVRVRVFWRFWQTVDSKFCQSKKWIEIREFWKGWVSKIFPLRVFLSGQLGRHL